MCLCGRSRAAPEPVAPPSSFEYVPACGEESPGRDGWVGSDPAQGGREAQLAYGQQGEGARRSGEIMISRNNADDERSNDRAQPDEGPPTTYSPGRALEPSVHAGLLAQGLAIGDHLHRAADHDAVCAGSRGARPRSSKKEPFSDLGRDGAGCAHRVHGSRWFQWRRRPVGEFRDERNQSLIAATRSSP